MKQGIYHRFWRWHFYAALFISPLLITLSFSGIGYLFYTDIENKIYSDLFFGKKPHTQPLSIDKGIEKVKKKI